MKHVILALIAEKPRHGYELIKDIEERLGGAYAPSPGVVYPMLTMLEELGQVSLESAEGGKKLYAITDAGKRTSFIRRYPEEYASATGGVLMGSAYASPEAEATA